MKTFHFGVCMYLLGDVFGSVARADVVGAILAGAMLLLTIAVLAWEEQA